ncbi:PREDICTED: interferon omega-1-like [Elephantulus edwardii]|uniref:interferon omega-1-like n=1 Tax=Elephantulus edwardii TaxID=28737 RepID=UPI0003F094C4|nr:PREDICTED: interferon omega-1-like [Elephantulus edwardii]
MAILLPLVAALIIVSTYGSVPSLGCDLSQNHILASNETIELLGQMKRLSSFFCLKDRQNFSLPREMADGSHLQKNQAGSVLHQTLQQIFQLFHTQAASAAWNTTLLEQLRSGLHLQLEHLETCFVQEMGKEESDLATDGPTLAVKRYFYGIRRYLKGKEYSDCAWEVVRVEIRKAFLLSSTNLQERLRRKDEDLLSP